jgi:HD domain.
MEEVELISDDAVQSGVERMFLEGVPDYFWTVAGSSSGKYHSPDERGEYGNLLHTKRMFVRYESMSESYLEAGVITEYERECGKASALLHDSLKQGWPSEGKEHTADNHDEIAADVAKHIGNLPREVYSLIRVHMGPWGEGPTPSNKHEWLFHSADKVATSVNEDSLAVHGVAEEVEEEWPNIETIKSE